MREPQPDAAASRKDWTGAVLVPVVSYSAAAGFVLGGTVGILLAPTFGPTRFWVLDGLSAGGLVGALFFYVIAWTVTVFFRVVSLFLNR